jgi:hypothetical protein
MCGPRELSRRRRKRARQEHRPAAGSGANLPQGPGLVNLSAARARSINPPCGSARARLSPAIALRERDRHGSSPCLPPGQAHGFAAARRAAVGFCGDRLKGRGAWDAERLIQFYRSLSASPRLARPRPFGLKLRSPRPDSSGTFGVLEASSLRSCRRSGLPPEPGLDRAFGPLRSDASGLLPIRFQPPRRPRRNAGRSDQTASLPNTPGAAESALGLPSPVDAFHRPQAPAPPHVTTPHERAPRVDGTGACKHI